MSSLSWFRFLSPVCAGLFAAGVCAAAPDPGSTVTTSGRPSALQMTPEQSARADKILSGAGTSEDVKAFAGKIDAVVDMGVKKVRAVHAADGTLVFLADGGRFAFTGPVIDVWQQKVLATIEDVRDAVERVDLKHMGWSPEKVGAVTVGTGTPRGALFVDPNCPWCHKLLAQMLTPEFLKKFSVDVVTVPLLGPASQRAAQLWYCTTEKDPVKLLTALQQGQKAIEALPQPEACQDTRLVRARQTAQAFGLEGVPYLVAPDGRFVNGYIEDVAGFFAGQPARRN